MAKQSKANKPEKLLKWTGPEEISLLLPDGRRVKAADLSQKDLEGLKARDNGFVK